MTVSPIVALTLATARLTAALGQWVLSRNPGEDIARELAEAAEEQRRAVAALRQVLNYPPESR